MGGMAMKIFNLAAGASQYLNIEAGTTDVTLSDVSGVSTGSPLVLDEPRLARLSQSTLPSSGAVTGIHRYLFTSPSGNFRISAASLGLYTRMKLTLELRDGATGATPTGTCTFTAADELTGSDAYLDCTEAPDSYVVQVTGTAVLCSVIPGNSSSTCTTNETASTSIPYYIINVFESANLTDTTLAGESLSASSVEDATYSNLPSCSSQSLLVTTGNEPTERDGGCCGSLSYNQPGGPKGPASFLLAMLLNPVLWLGIYQSLKAARRALGHVEN